MVTKWFRNPWALSSALAALGTLQLRVLGFLNHLVTLVSAPNYYIVSNTFFTQLKLWFINCVCLEPSKLFSGQNSNTTHTIILEVVYTADFAKQPITASKSTSHSVDNHLRILCMWERAKILMDWKQYVQKLLRFYFINFNSQ